MEHLYESDGKAPLACPFDTAVKAAVKRERTLIHGCARFSSALEAGQGPLRTNSATEAFS
jgi:hypothetical protein